MIDSGELNATFKSHRPPSLRAIPVPYGYFLINALILQDNQEMAAIHWAGIKGKMVAVLQLSLYNYQ